jgi:Peptidase family M1 domain
MVWGLCLTAAALAAPSLAATTGPAAHPRPPCGPGARTLAADGSRLYPDTGNGGYVSVHTDIHMVYDATSNTFLPGNHVVLTDRATQCLTSFSLDFERDSANTTAGPDMSVRSVLVDGEPATFKFAQPAYPGDQKGPNDRNPAAHEASEFNPVGGPDHNALPPACTPELPSTNPAQMASLDGTQCPPNKLVITPRRPVRDRSVFRVAVFYTGRPGVHDDGDGSTAGWFRAPDGGFVTTEPVGSEDWMPLNDYPTAKPTYDSYDTVTAGETAIANGILLGVSKHRPTSEFPHGSVTWHWRETSPVASYLVEDSVGNFSIREHTAANGIRFYQVLDKAFGAKLQEADRQVLNTQPDITAFESQLNGPYPFKSDGAIVGVPRASFEEEMETMIAFAGGFIDTDILYHENMHQWWGDNFTEGGYRLTFYKEGLATLAEYLFAARTAAELDGGRGSATGRAAFQRSLDAVFQSVYRSGGSFWAAAPSNPIAFGLFSPAGTYQRPAAAYIALRQILGHRNFDKALQQMQRRYGGGHITEAELEAGFARWMPNHSRACQARLGRFFTQWFDTAYPRGGGSRRPVITGPGLAGPGFYGVAGCRSARRSVRAGVPAVPGGVIPQAVARSRPLASAGQSLSMSRAQSSYLWALDIPGSRLLGRRSGLAAAAGNALTSVQPPLAERPVPCALGLVDALRDTPASTTGHAGRSVPACSATM